MEYSIKNIRSYETEQSISLNKMNVIVGENSAGKSTMCRILPLLAQSSKVQSGTIEWFGEYVDFGLEENVKNRKSEDIEICFRITLERYLKYPGSRRLLLTQFDEKKNGNLNNYDNYVRLHIDKDKINKITFLKSENEIEFNKMGLISKINGEKFDSKEDYIVFRNNLIPQFYKRLYYHIDENKELIEEDKIINNLNIISNCFEGIINGLHYIGPYRSYGDRYYRLKRKVEFNLTPDGTNLISYLKHFRQKQLEKLNTFIEKNFSFSLDLGSLNEKENIELRIIDSSKKSINIVDLGSGYSQILPIIISVFECTTLNSDNHTVVIEQPELHLHPKLQKKLAYTLYDIVTASNNTKIIMETHSTDIVYALAECEGKKSNLNLNIFNCSQTTSGTKIEKYNVTDEGYINWPRNFLQ